MNTTKQYIPVIFHLEYIVSYCYRLPLFHIAKSPNNIIVSRPWHNVVTQRWQKYSKIQHRHNLVQQPTNDVGPTLNQHSLVCG